MKHERNTHLARRLAGAFEYGRVHGSQRNSALAIRTDLLLEAIGPPRSPDTLVGLRSALEHSAVGRGDVARELLLAVGREAALQPQCKLHAYLELRGL